MIVTELIPLSTDRCKVYIDQEFAFVLYKGELRLYGLRAGEEISEENYQEIRQNVLPKRAKLRAMNLLQKKRYTRRQLEEKLQEGLYPAEIVQEAVAYVESYGYIDDLQLAVDYITYHEKDKSRRRLIGDLMQKGISGDTIELAFGEWQSMGGEQDECDMIGELLVKKRYRPDCDEKEKRRMYAFLLRKGFSAENVRCMLECAQSS